MLFQNTPLNIPFPRWLYEDRENKRMLWLACLLITIQFIWFKTDCPRPTFIPDSYSYLTAAWQNDFIHIRPIGYSKFLRFFSSFSGSHLLLVLTQYLLLQASLLYLFLTVRFLLHPATWLWYCLLGITVINPVLLRMANFITSDALFTALSLIWFTQLLWLQYKPTRRLLLAHACVILLTFTIRYNALYYPIISILAIVCTREHWIIKLGATALIMLLLGAFVMSTQHAYQKKTNTTQFSGFGGWQLAINALYAYAHEPPDAINSMPVRFRALHLLVNKHMDSLRHTANRPDAQLGIYYLSAVTSPLNVYLHSDTTNSRVTDNTNRWLMQGVLFGQYGSYLIKNHRKAWFNYFLFPNMRNYWRPSAEFLSSYYVMGSATIDPLAVYWFNLDDNKDNTYPGDFRIAVINQLPLVFAISNIIFVTGFLALVISSRYWGLQLYIKKILLFILLVWGCNLVFSIMASVIVLRYQIFPMMITCTFGVLLMMYTCQHIWQTHLKNKHIHAASKPSAAHSI